MKKGDKVMIDDGSWTRSVVGGKMIHESLAYSNARNIQYTIIETDCIFPNTGDSGICNPGGRPSFNNTVIQAIDSGKVVFIEERFLRPVPPKHKVMIDVEQINYAICGNIVEISDKLYKEIKRGT